MAPLANTEKKISPPFPRQLDLNMEDWEGHTAGFKPFKAEIRRLKISVLTTVKTKKFIYSMMVLFFSVAYLLWPVEQVQKDNFGRLVENAIIISSKEMIPCSAEHDLQLRNSSITIKEFDEGMILVNSTHYPTSRNITGQMLQSICKEYYKANPDEICVCFRNFGLLIRGACVNVTGTVEPALNIFLDRNHWSNNDKEYKVNGRLIGLPDKTTVEFVNHRSKKYVTKEQYTNICLIHCYDGYCT